jgi:hypothetical protein
MSPRAFLFVMLLITETGMLLMAALFLSGRRGLGWLDYLAWALVALLLPLMGSVLVIAFRPGVPRNAPAREDGPSPADPPRRLRVDDRSVM